jgi:hypothetical protein
MKNHFFAKFLFLGLALGWPLLAWPQRDSTRLGAALVRGKVTGLGRNFLMINDNAPGLRDTYGNALAVALRYETGQWRGFRLVLGGSVVYKIAGSDLAQPDPFTGAPDRYVLGLYEVTDPSRTQHLARLEELALQYQRGRFKATLGKQLLAIPWLNPQDGRMRPSFFEGLWLEVPLGKKAQVMGGFIYRASPRSTTGWYGVARSMGTYPTGVNPDGSRSGYANHLTSQGLGILGGHYRLGGRHRLTGWHWWPQNIYRLSMLQLAREATPPAQAQGHWQVVWAAQVLHQAALGQGGNPDPAKAYLGAGSRAWAWGARVGLARPRSLLTLNYTRISGHGRLLSPREWGLEPYFTFMKRERNDGFGDLHAINVYVVQQWPKKRLRLEGGVGHYQLPDVKNFRLNKYGLPSYWQVNLEVRYRFRGFWEGLEIQWLTVYKANAGDWAGNERNRINKVDMWNHNLVVNYAF